MRQKYAFLGAALSLFGCGSDVETVDEPSHASSFDEGTATEPCDAAPPPSSGADAGVVEAGKPAEEWEAALDSGLVSPDAGVVRLVSSRPGADEADVYPSPFGDGSSYEFEVLLEFSGPMDSARTTVQFGPRGGQLTSHDVSWADATVARFAIQPPPLAPQILQENTAYVVDYSALLPDPAGAVEPRFEFTTGAYDALLNHSCGHTAFGPFGAGVAAPLGDAASFSLTATHTQYALRLASTGETFGGAVNLSLPISGPYRLYFDRSATAEHILGDAVTSLTVDPAPRSCSGITHSADVTLDASLSTLVMQDVETQTIHVIVESLAE